MIALGEEAPPEQIGQVQIRFVPYQNDTRVVASYYQAADVYMHAARVDTFPYTVLEAMACGTPVVATATGGIPEQIEDGVTGFLVPPGDSEAMAQRVRAVLENSQLRRGVGQRAAQTARRRFDFQRQVGEYLSWYEAVAERHAALS